jgi:FAD:protein FMN transferase
VTAAVAEQPRRSFVEQVMGLPVSVLVRGPDARAPMVADAVAALHAELRRMDATFSTYRPTSEVSRLRSGELPPAAASPVVQQVLALCEQARRDTDGWFDAWLPDASGGRSLDPSGLVKGWAAERAAAALAGLPDLDWLVNAGGDVLGRARSGRPWRVAVEDPRDRSRVLAVLPLRDGAVATSGTAARGAHLIDPHTGRPAAPGLLSATVTGPSLTTADVHATALCVEGPAGLRRIDAMPGYGALVVLRDGRLLGTPGMRESLSAPGDRRGAPTAARP